MRTTVWHRLLLAGLVAMVSATALAQAGSLSGSVDRGNARSWSSPDILPADDGYGVEEEIDEPVYVLDNGRTIIQRHDRRHPRPDPRTVGRRLPPGLGLGVGSNIGSDIGVPGIGAGIGSDTRLPLESARINGGARPHKPEQPPRHRPRDRRWADDDIR
ncbi:MAG: hypothetical protein EOP40_09080 [Rubrivivax sp.]|nr:MAG: hypothetical protein EOP40_09080 [Rubrivivax sp.]